jgi:ketosteroid isomerase-like protein
MTPTAAEAGNIEVVTRFIDLMNDRGIEAVEREIEILTHPEVEWRPGMNNFGKDLYTGWDELREYIRQALEAKAESYLNVYEVRPLNEHAVLALAWVHYRARTGRTFDGEYALLVGIEDGRLRTIESFLSHKAAERVAARA